MRFAAILPLLLLGGPALAQAPPCDGTYEAFMGKSTAQALPGNALPNAGRVAQAYNNREGWIGQIIPKPHSEGLHEVTVSQCGRQFVMTQGGKKMVFLQSALDETVYVAQDIGVDHGEMTLRVVDHKIMVGQLAGKSHGFGYNFPLALEPRDISMPDMEGCQDDVLPEEPDSDENRLTVDPALRSEVMDIVADEIDLPRDQAGRYLSAPETVSRTRSASNGPTVILPGEPGCPKEFAGIRTCRAYPPDTHRIVEVSMLLDEDGRLLPVATTPQGRTYVDDPDAANYCSLERSLPSAARLLRMTFYGLERDDMNNVQAILADARTGIFEKGYLAERQTGSPKGGAITSRQQRADATAEAYDGIGSPVTGRH